MSKESGKPLRPDSTSFRPSSYPALETDRESSRLRLLMLLSKCVNPKTGRVYTFQELGQIFKTHHSTIQKELSETSAARRPAPEVKHEDLPENERSFFVGLCQDGYSVARLHRRVGDFVVVSTRSPNRKREILKTSLGSWGEIHESATEARIYLPSPQFDFALAPNVRARDLSTKSKFAPFMLGALSVRLSDRLNRFSLGNGSLLVKVGEEFYNHFNFRMGSVQMVDNHTGENCRQSYPVIEVENPGRVFGALVGVATVRSLPFLPDLARIS